MHSKARPWLVRGTVATIVLFAIGLGAWLAGRDSSSERAVAPIGEVPQTVTPHELATIAARAGGPVYWAGEMLGKELEAYELADGGVQVRYVNDEDEPPTGTAETGEGWTEAEGWVGTDEAKRITGDTPMIGSYPLPDPAGAVAALAAQPEAIVRRSENGRVVVASAERPTSVYFASPDNRVQVEVFDPSSARALRLALSLHVRPAG